MEAAESGSHSVARQAVVLALASGKGVPRSVEASRVQNVRKPGFSRTERHRAECKMGMRGMPLSISRPELAEVRDSCVRSALSLFSLCVPQSYIADLEMSADPRRGGQ